MTAVKLDQDDIDYINNGDSMTMHRVPRINVSRISSEHSLEAELESLRNERDRLQENLTALMNVAQDVLSGKGSPNRLESLRVVLNAIIDEEEELSDR